LGLRQRREPIPATRPALDVDSIAEGSTVKGVCEKLHKLFNYGRTPFKTSVQAFLGLKTMAEKKKLSVAEILAAARAEKASGASAAAASDVAAPVDAASSTPTAVQVGASQPSPTPKPAVSKPAGTAGRPSIAEIMALTRAKNTAVATAEGPASAPVAAEKKVAAAKPTAAKPAEKSPMQRDTASILAAARSGTKPGPVSKSELPPGSGPGAMAKQSAASAKASPVARVPPPAVRPLPPAPVRPVKPEAKKAAASTEDRRGFLSFAMGSFMAIGFTALSATGGLFTLGLARFMFPNVLAEPPSRFKVGFRESFPAGKVETKFVAQFGVWVINSEFQGQQQIYALKTVCTHLGCTPNWLEAEQKFKCPCHGSGFYKDGINFEGPAPRPLERYAIRLSDDGQLEIDKSKAFHEELGQWAEPESYVSV